MTKTDNNGLFILEDHDIKEFQALYKKYYGIDLDEEVARDLAHHLITFMSFILVEK